MSFDDNNAYILYVTILNSNSSLSVRKNIQINSGLMCEESLEMCLDRLRKTIASGSEVTSLVLMNVECSPEK